MNQLSLAVASTSKPRRRFGQSALVATGAGKAARVATAAQTGLGPGTRLFLDLASAQQGQLLRGDGSRYVVGQGFEGPGRQSAERTPEMFRPAGQRPTRAAAAQAATGSLAWTMAQLDRDPGLNLGANPVLRKRIRDSLAIRQRLFDGGRWRTARWDEVDTFGGRIEPRDLIDVLGKAKTPEGQAALEMERDGYLMMEAKGTDPRTLEGAMARFDMVSVGKPTWGKRPSVARDRVKALYAEALKKTGQVPIELQSEVWGQVAPGTDWLAEFEASGFQTPIKGSAAGSGISAGQLAETANYDRNVRLIGPGLAGFLEPAERLGRQITDAGADAIESVPRLGPAVAGALNPGLGALAGLSPDTERLTAEVMAGGPEAILRAPGDVARTFTPADVPLGDRFGSFLNALGVVAGAAQVGRAVGGGGRVGGMVSRYLGETGDDLTRLGQKFDQLASKWGYGRAAKLMAREVAPEATPEEVAAIVDAVEAADTGARTDGEAPRPRGTRLPSRELMDPDDIGIEPGMQYKADVTDAENAVTSKFKDVDTYNVTQGGEISVWEKLDGSRVVVHGHHRRELARRASRFTEDGPEGLIDVDRQVPVRVYREADGWSKTRVRQIGAIENLRNGDGSALDATMVLRELGLGRDDLPGLGVQVRTSLGRDVEGMMGLGERALAEVRKGEVSPSMAAGIGSVDGLTDEGQVAAIVMAGRSGARTYDDGARFGRIYRDSLVPGQESLFGDAEMVSTMPEQAKIEAGARAALLNRWSELRRGMNLEELPGERINRDLRAEELERLGKKAGLAWRFDKTLENYDDLKALRADLARRLNSGKINERQAIDELARAVTATLGDSVKQLIGGRRADGTYRGSEPGGTGGRVGGDGTDGSGASAAPVATAGDAGADAGTVVAEVRDADSFGAALRATLGQVVDEEEIIGVEAVVAARAKTWAAATGADESLYYGERLAEFRLDDAGAAGAARQATPLGAKGAAKVMQDGRVVVHFFTGKLAGSRKSDVSTAVHELAHVFFRELDQDQFASARAGWGGTDVDGDFEEWFARGFERYLADGTAPNEDLRGVFARFKDWMLEVYRSIRGSAIGQDVPLSLRATFDSLLDGQGRVARDAGAEAADAAAAADRAGQTGFGFQALGWKDIVGRMRADGLDNAEIRRRLMRQWGLKAADADSVMSAGALPEHAAGANAWAWNRAIDDWQAVDGKPVLVAGLEGRKLFSTQVRGVRYVVDEASGESLGEGSSVADAIALAEQRAGARGAEWMNEWLDGLAEDRAGKRPSVVGLADQQPGLMPDHAPEPPMPQREQFGRDYTDDQGAFRFQAVRNGDQIRFDYSDDDGQLRFDLNVRPGYTTADAERAAQGLRFLRNRGKTAILARSFADDLVQTGHVRLLGKTVATPDDVAAAVAAARNPGFEVGRWIGVARDGRIVAHTYETARLSGVAPVGSTEAPMSKFVAWFLRTSEEPVETVFHLHNHPSGMVDPSREDVYATGVVDKAIRGMHDVWGARFGGELIINGGKFTWIPGAGRPPMVGLPYRLEGADYLAGGGETSQRMRDAGEVWGATEAAQLPGLVSHAEMRHGLDPGPAIVGLDAQLQIRIIARLSENALESAAWHPARAAAWVSNMARKNGVRRLMLVMPGDEMPERVGEDVLRHFTAVIGNSGKTLYEYGGRQRDVFDKLDNARTAMRRYQAYQETPDGPRRLGPGFTDEPAQDPKIDVDADGQGGFKFQEAEAGVDRPFEPIPGLRLRSLETIKTKVQGPVEANALRRMLANNGVKDDEMVWSGLADWLDRRQGLKVKPEEVEEFLRSEEAGRFEEIATDPEYWELEKLVRKLDRGTDKYWEQFGSALSEGGRAWYLPERLKSDRVAAEAWSRDTVLYQDELREAGVRAAMRGEISEHFIARMPEGAPREAALLYLQNERDRGAVMERLSKMKQAGRGTQYHTYKLPGGSKYAERILRYDRPPGLDEEPRVVIGERGPFRDYLIQGRYTRGYVVPVSVDGKMARITYVDEAFNYRDEPLGPRWSVDGLGLNGVWHETFSGALEMVRETARHLRKTGATYKSAHWRGVVNPVAHVRESQRRVSIGGRRLRAKFLEEVQSDWHQTGRERGYKQVKPGGDSLPRGFRLREDVESQTFGPWMIERQLPGGNWMLMGMDNTRERALAQAWELAQNGSVAAGPMAKTWHETVMRRMLRQAVDEGQEALAWTVGDTHAERYGQMLAENVDSLTVSRRPNGEYLLVAERNGRVALSDTMPEGQLRETIGGEMADQAIAGLSGNSETWSVSSGDFVVGGHGMRSFYDRMLPSYAKKLGKRFGVEPVKGTTRADGDVEVWVLPINDAMRRSVLDEGQYLFQEAEVPGVEGPIVQGADGELTAPKGLDPAAADPELAAKMAAEVGFDQITPSGVGNSTWGRKRPARIEPAKKGKKSAVERNVVGFVGNAFDQMRTAGAPGSKARQAGRTLAALTEKTLAWSTAHATRLGMALDGAMTEHFGKAYRLAGKGKQANREFGRKMIEVQLGIRSLEDLTPAERAVNEVKTRISQALRREADALKVMVDRVVTQDMKYVPVGEVVTWFGPDGQGGQRVMLGQVIGHAPGELQVRAYGGNAYTTLRFGDRFRSRSLVSDEAFFPLRFTDDALQQLQEEQGPIYDRALEKVAGMLKESGRLDTPDQAAQYLRRMLGTDFGERVYVDMGEEVTYTGGPIRLERPRLPFNLDPDAYETDFAEVMSGHIGAAAKRLTMARVFGSDSWRVADLLQQMGPEARGIQQEFARAMGHDEALTTAMEAARSVASWVGTWQALSKMTGLGTALVQISALGNSVGMLGFSAAAKGLVRAVRSIGDEGGEIARVRMSGAVSDEAIRLMGVDDAQEQARFLTGLALNVTGVKPIDKALRYHAAMAGRAAAEAAVARLRVEGKAVKRDATYRFLSDVMRFSDDDIGRLALSRTLEPRDVVTAYHGGAGTQLRSRAGDMPKSVVSSPFGRMLMQLQTFNYQQAKLIGWTVQEAARGNPVPLLRTVAAYTALGYITVEAKDRLIAGLENKAPKEVSEVLGVRLTNLAVRGGMLGVFGRGAEVALRNMESPEDETAAQTARGYERALMDSILPIVVRDVSNLFGAAAFAQKTGSVGMGVDEWLRRSVVPYGRIARRGDPDYRWIEREREKEKRRLAEEGWSDTDIERFLERVLPRPSPRGATAEYGEWLERYYRLIQEEGFTPEEAREELGRRPQKFAGDAPEPEREPEPTGTFEMEIMDAEPRVGPDGRRLVGAGR